MRQYPGSIADNAQRYGFKGVNLLHLTEIIAEFNKLNDIYIKSSVPEISLIANDDIISHLRTHVTDFDSE